MAVRRSDWSGGIAPAAEVRARDSHPPGTLHSAANALSAEQTSQGVSGF